MGNFHGQIANEGSLQGKITEVGSLHGKITNSEQTLRGRVNVGNINQNNNYEKLTNLPRINGIELIGDLTLSELGSVEITNEEIDTIVQEVFDEEE